MKFVLPLLLSFNVYATSGSVLFVGDSHSVGPFGWTFDRHLRDAGHTVQTFASCGSVPGWWISGRGTTCGYYSRNAEGREVKLASSPTPLMASLLDAHRPDVVVLEFGGNYLPSSDSSFIKRDIRALISLIKASGAQCFWITNPDTRNFRSEIPRVLALIKEAINDDCPIFESHLVTIYPPTGGDGTHYWNPELTPQAVAWAEKAFESFAQSWRNR